MKRSCPFLLSALAALALAAGCGRGDDSSSPNATQPGQAQAAAEAEAKLHNEAVREEYEQRQRAEAPSEDEEGARQVAADFYAVLGQDKAKGNPNKVAIDSISFCELMSEEAIAQTIHYARASSGIDRQWDCESAVDLMVLRSKRSGGFRGVQSAEVLGVHARGDRATATVQFGNGVATSIPMVKEDGEWKLAASPAPKPTH